MNIGGLLHSNMGYLFFLIHFSINIIYLVSIKTRTCFNMGFNMCYPRMKISILKDISVLGFYGYIGDISMDIFT